MAHHFKDFNKLRSDIHMFWIIPYWYCMDQSGSLTVSLTGSHAGWEVVSVLFKLAEWISEWWEEFQDDGREKPVWKKSGCTEKWESGTHGILTWVKYYLVEINHEHKHFYPLNMLVGKCLDPGAKIAVSASFMPCDVVLLTWSSLKVHQCECWHWLWCIFSSYIKGSRENLSQVLFSHSSVLTF